MKYGLLFLLILFSLTFGACRGRVEPHSVVQLKVSASEPVTNIPSPLNAALIAAAGKGDDAKLSELLRQGADVNARNTTGSTPLIEAVYYNHAATVSLLLSNGADPNKRKEDGATALGFAQQYPAIAAILKSHGATVISNSALNPHLMGAAGSGDLAQVESLIQSGAFINSYDAEGRTPLIEAVYNGHTEVVKYLLEQGADPNARKNDGATALGFARKHPEITGLLKAAGARE